MFSVPRSLCRKCTLEQVVGDLTMTLKLPQSRQKWAMDQIGECMAGMTTVHAWTTVHGWDDYSACLDYRAWLGWLQCMPGLPCMAGMTMVHAWTTVHGWDDYGACLDYRAWLGWLQCMPGLPYMAGMTTVHAWAKVHACLGWRYICIADTLSDLRNAVINPD